MTVKWPIEISVFMARPILKSQQLPYTIEDLFAGTFDIEDTANDLLGYMPSSEEVVR